MEENQEGHLSEKPWQDVFRKKNEGCQEVRQDDSQGCLGFSIKEVISDSSHCSFGDMVETETNLQYIEKLGREELERMG